MALRSDREDTRTQEEALRAARDEAADVLAELAAAARLDARNPTSAGAGWVALGAALLDPVGTPLSPCHPAG